MMKNTRGSKKHENEWIRSYERNEEEGGGGLGWGARPSLHSNFSRHLTTGTGGHGWVPLDEMRLPTRRLLACPVGARFYSDVVAPSGSVIFYHFGEVNLASYFLSILG